MKDKQLKIGIIGGTEKRTIQIVNYNENWPIKFEGHSSNIRDILGDVVVNIEHIGSTSVPGLAAKPIIDILLIVKDSSDESKYLTRMESAGYELRVREPDFHEHRMFRTIKKDVHIHIFSEGSSEIDRYLVFKNRLRQNDSDRKEYESIKRKLASNDWNKMDDYAKAKTEVIERIISSGLNSRRAATNQRLSRIGKLNSEKRMVHFNFIAGNKFELDDFKSVDKFVESYSDFQTVFLKNEEELLLLLKLLGIEEINSQRLSDSEFSKYWDFSNFKLPEFNKEQFDEFYENWIKCSDRDNNMDEYGSLIFLQGLSQKWNNLAYRIIVKEP